MDLLNGACFCFSLDESALARALDSVLGQAGLAEMVRQRCPFLFAAQPVFVPAPQLQRMAQVMQAVESVVALPAFREQVLAAAPQIARLGTSGPLGVFFGYDFHLSHGQLALIEVNTNAGGAMLNAVLARAQRACCTEVQGMVPSLASVVAFEQQIVDMFRHEWQLAQQAGAADKTAGVHVRHPLRSIAIVDLAPEDQYLYPEFLLFQRLFERHGLRTVIADPATLEWRDGVLWHGELAIDLVYNRLTDFYLEQPSSAALREAYLQQAVVLTPHPQVHALYADKRHLALFSDAAQLQALEVPQATQDILLAHVPRTEVVDAADAQRFWDARRSLFFKPVAGFGSRAAYRGDKLTKRVWQDILAGDYVAQAIVAPGERVIDSADVTVADVAAEASVATKAMKYDLRAYTYNGAVQWMAARLYKGQTTNFRTPGGGFAPVYSSVDVSGASGPSCASGDDDGVTPHASFVFLLDPMSGVHPVPHTLYVALARGEATLEAMAGQTLRLADWFVRLKCGAPDLVVNETYSLVCFDAQGRVDPAHAPSSAQPPAATPENPAWPTLAEREQMQQMLFGTTPSPNASDAATAAN
ncbi:hypothetical protein LPB72_09885 [Hydrogenophaga crassostreae]|uniref:ATP-grasp domain-containing protein n=1 Tax=Hydrogenophaga crassostreae TaxID=1763535 RepID=A0A167HRE8_9BURK|nr:hypothetical protein [Hydrogenophaga crassostreae]AOW13347.1 hypothetical protein LPB072_11265 [Hydrogenophaga crassostreae]OAD41630.1 hypothetical protein LPB72_09885 [Hydrogenophaga crassostreae]